VLDSAWLVLWNATDESPENCRIFLERDGLKIFLRCYETFPKRMDMRVQMTGVKV